MLCEVIAIGGEILGGLVINSNSTFISRHLAFLGFNTTRHTVVPDNENEMTIVLKEALSRVDLVIVTGGLGPTLDDITRKVAAKLFASDFIYDEKIAEDLKKRFGPHLSSLSDQATVPSKAHILKNSIGTAPGFVFEDKGKVLALLPGVPLEMQVMLKDELGLFLKSRFPFLNPLSQKTLHFTTLTENMVDPLLRDLQAEFPGIDMGIYPSYGTLSVTIKSKDEKIVETVKKRLLDSFGSYHYDAPSGKIEEALLELLKKKKKQLAVAESCTGGLVAHRLTLIPGASESFLGSLVVYSNELKQEILGVNKDTLTSHGAVSKEAVEEMLQGLFRETSADYGIAISGIAGPSGGSSEKPVGTVWLCYGQRDKPFVVKRMDLQGRQREVIIMISSQRAIGALYRMLAFDAC